MNTSEKRSRLTVSRFKRNKTMKAIKISLLTLAAIVALYVGPASGDVVKGYGYVHSVLVKDNGKIFFIAKDGQGVPKFTDASGCSENESGFVELDKNRITPANMAYFFKMLSIAQVTKHEMVFNVYCPPSQPQSNASAAANPPIRPVLKTIRYDD